MCCISSRPNIVCYDSLIVLTSELFMKSINSIEHHAYRQYSVLCTRMQPDSRYTKFKFCISARPIFVRFISAIVLSIELFIVRDEVVIVYTCASYFISMEYIENLGIMMN